MPDQYQTRPALNLCPDWLQPQKDNGAILFPGLPNGSSADQVSAWLYACAASVLFAGANKQNEATTCTKASSSDTVLFVTYVCCQEMNKRFNFLKESEVSARAPAHRQILSAYMRWHRVIPA